MLQKFFYLKRYVYSFSLTRCFDQVLGEANGTEKGEIWIQFCHLPAESPNLSELNVFNGNDHHCFARL